jgi:hypothetical protein
MMPMVYGSPQKEQNMRKVVVSVYKTLDGVMEAPEKWSGQFLNAEHGQYARDLLSTCHKSLAVNQSQLITQHTGERA